MLTLNTWVSTIRSMFTFVAIQVHRWRLAAFLSLAQQSRRDVSRCRPNAIRRRTWLYCKDDSLSIYHSREDYTLPLNIQ